jgi:transcriptional regulator with XRE-family HTH domain
MAKLSERDRERLSLFVDEMIAQRTARGWSQADLANAASYSKSLIAQVEIYDRAPTEQLARALDRAYGMPDTFLRLYRKIRGGFPAAFGEFAEYEAKAKTLLIFEHSYIPGQLQTEAYAQAVLEHHPNVTPDEVAERVEARTKRRAVVTRKEPAPPMLWVLIGEQVLDQEIGGPAVMADQLAQLAEAAVLPNVTIQVIPRSFGAHPGMQGTFYVAEFTGRASIVFTEDILSGKISDDPAAVAEATLTWRYLASVALPVGASLELIQEKQKRWTAETTRGARALTAVPTAEDASK